MMSADTTQLPQLSDSPPQLDVTRAIGVLNAAMRHNMFPENGVPESEVDKIGEAEKLIELARQSWAVAQQIGPGNVPNYQAIIDVLAEAELFLGIGSSPGPASAPEQQAPPPPPPPSAVASEPPPGPAQVAAEDQVVAAQHAQVYGDGQEIAPTGDASSTADPAGAATQPATPATPEIEVPVNNEVWEDANGGQWQITRGGNYPQIEVSSLATGESTLVPSGFLKRRLAVAPPIQEPPLSPPPSSPPVSQPSASSSPDGGSPAAPPQPPTPTAPNATSGSESPPASPPPPSDAASSFTSSSTSEQSVSVIPVYDTEGDNQYENLVEQVEGDYSPSAMPAPMDLEQPPEGMPDDLTAVGDIEQRKLHSQFNALAARARYLRGFEDAMARGCKRLRSSYMKIAMREARQSLGKDASVTEVTQLAEDDINVHTWTERMTRHQERSDAFKVFFDMYSEHVSVLSRDWTMRDREARA